MSSEDEVPEIEMQISFLPLEVLEVSLLGMT